MVTNRVKDYVELLGSKYDLTWIKRHKEQEMTPSIFYLFLINRYQKEINHFWMNWILIIVSQT